MSYITFAYHIIFSTYRREKTIVEEHERLVYKAIYFIAKEKGAKIYRIGGMPDHIHLLISIPPNKSVSGFVKVLKQETSKYIASLPQFPKWNGWEEGYGGFTVSFDVIEDVINYISSQKAHHSVTSFKDEFRLFLSQNGINPDTFQPNNRSFD